MFQETLLVSKSLGLIASDDNHGKRGFIMISCRSICNQAFEIAHHLFSDITFFML